MIDRRFLWVLALAAIHHGSFCLLIAALPAAMLAQHASTVEVGTAVGAFGAGAILTRVTCFRFMDSLSLVRLFRLSGLLLVLSCFGYLMLGENLLVVLPRMSHGAAFALFSTAVGLWIGEAIPERRRGRARGLEGGLVGVWVVLGPVAGLALLDQGGLRLLYGVMSVVALFALLPPANIGARVPMPPPGGTKPNLREPIFVLLLAGVAMGTLQAFLPLLAAWKQMHSLTGIFVAFGLALIVGRLGGGWWSDAIGRLRVIRIAAAAVAASLVLQKFAPGGPPLLAVCVMFGLAIGALTTATLALVTDRVSGRPDAGRWLSTASLCWELGVATGPVALGYFGLRQGAEGIALGAMLVGGVLLAAAMLTSARPRVAEEPSVVGGAPGA